jgi:diguanylate cyclase (GGDEF)-like protein
MPPNFVLSFDLPRPRPPCMNPTPLTEATWPPGVTVALLAALDAQGVIWWLKSPDGRYRHLNVAGHALFELACDMAGGLSDADLLPPVQAAALRAADLAALAQVHPVQAEHQIDAGGQRRALSAWRVAVQDPSSSGALLLGLWFDAGPLRQCGIDLRVVLDQLEQQQRTNEELRAELEAGGAAPGRHRLLPHEQFDESLRREVDRAQREQRDFALAFIGVDAPPPGSPAHAAGGRESVHQALAELLRNNTRAMDAAARLDGERFAVLLSGVGLATAYTRMEGLRRQCAARRVARGGEALRFTISMGLASFPHTAPSQAGVVAAAEAALALAQQRGGNRVTLAAMAFDAPAAA